MGSFPSKFIIKSGYEGKFWQLEVGSFLKTGRQTPLHPQIVYPPEWTISILLFKMCQMQKLGGFQQLFATEVALFYLKCVFMTCNVQKVSWISSSERTEATTL